MHGTGIAIKNNSVYRKAVGIPLYMYATASSDNGFTGRNK